MTSGIIVLVVLILLFIIVVAVALSMSRKIQQQNPAPEGSVVITKEDDYETILKKFEVPENHYKIVISQARTYNVVNCPAVIWLEGEKVKVLVLKSQPLLAEEELEDFSYIASSPFVNFRQFDGTEFPDWTRQSDEIKKLFLPYVEMTVAPGGIDRFRQQYWAGTICVYAPSLAEIFKMIGKPLSAYELTIENPKRMREDGSIPTEMLEEFRAEKELQKNASENVSKKVPVEELRQYKMLLDEGIMTEDEFNQKKKELLGL